MTNIDGLKCVHYGDIYKNYTNKEVVSSSILNSISLKFPKHKIIKQNAIIIADVSETLDDWGHVTFVRFDGTTFINGTHTFAIVSDCEVTLKYLFYFLRYNANIKMLRQFLTGVTVFQMSIKSLSNYNIELPPLKIQTRIAEILSAYDDAIENNNRRIAILEDTARELYREWFVRFRFPGYEKAKFVNGLPEGWEIRKIKSIIKRLPFRNLYKENDVADRGSVIVIDQSKDECLGFHDNEADYAATSEKPIILFGDHSCKMMYMTSSFSLGENVIPFASNSEMPEAYLFAIIFGMIETIEYKRHWTELMSKKAVVAAEPLQHCYANIVKPFYSQIETLRIKNRFLAHQRDLLIPRLMSGKLEV